jgi:hypothetical protein
MRSNKALLGRLAVYAAARDSGQSPEEAIRTLPYTSEGTMRRYERWYRQQRGLPPRPGWFTVEWYATHRGRIIERELP